jgi:hypothetical protein
MPVRILLHHHTEVKMESLAAGTDMAVDHRPRYIGWIAFLVVLLVSGCASEWHGSPTYLWMRFLSYNGNRIFVTGAILLLLVVRAIAAGGAMWAQSCSR